MKKYLSLFLCLVCLMLMTGCSNTCRDLAYDTDIVIENLVDAKDNFFDSLAEATDNIFRSLANFFHGSD